MNSFVEELSKKYNATIIDYNLKSIRDENHSLYYKVDIPFLHTVDAKYEVSAKAILARYNRIRIKNVFSLGFDESVKLNEYLEKICSDINKLKDVVKDDLNTVIDYVDRLFDKIDVSMITRDTPLGILILNKYDAFKIYSADINLSDLNATMKRQSKRLMYLKELDYLINNYKKLNNKYNCTNT